MKHGKLTHDERHHDAMVARDARQLPLVGWHKGL
jgi:hypothetical protein